MPQVVVFRVLSEFFAKPAIHLSTVRGYARIPYDL
jgi:hypothetical protein